MPESLPGYDDWKLECPDDEEERWERLNKRRRVKEEMAEERAERERDERES